MTSLNNGWSKHATLEPKDLATVTTMHSGFWLYLTSVLKSKLKNYQYKQDLVQYSAVRFSTIPLVLSKGIQVTTEDDIHYSIMIQILHGSVI